MSVAAQVNRTVSSTIQFKRLGGLGRQGLLTINDLGLVLVTSCDIFWHDVGNDWKMLEIFAFSGRGLAAASSNFLPRSNYVIKHSVGLL